MFLTISTQQPDFNQHDIYNRRTDNQHDIYKQEN